jgi:hypothetical protein
MFESFADHGHWDSGGEHEAGLTVSEVVEADRSEPGGVAEFGKPFGHGLGVQGGAVLFGEDVAAVDPGLRPHRALLLLPQSMAEQCSDSCFVQVDYAVLAAGRFDHADVGGVSKLDESTVGASGA